MAGHFNFGNSPEEVLKALFSGQGSPLNVPTAQQQGIGAGQTPVPPLPQQGVPQQSPGAQGGGQGTGLLAILSQILQNPGVLNSIGQVGSAFAGRDQLADFQRVTQQNQQLKLAKRARAAEEARVDISRKNLKVNEGNLTARQQEERNRNNTEQARARALELKTKQDNEQATIGILIRDGQAVSETKMVKGFGEAARGISIKPALSAGQVKVHIPADRTDILDALGERVDANGDVTLPQAQAQALLTKIIAGRPVTLPRTFNIDGKIIREFTNPEGKLDYEEVFDIGREPTVPKPTRFPLLEQERIREFLASEVDGWNELGLVERNTMINTFWEIELNSNAPQPVTSKVSTGMWNYLKRLTGRGTPSEREIITGFTDPDNPTLSDRAKQFLETGQ